MADSAKDAKEEKRRELEQKLSKNQREIEEILCFIQDGRSSEGLQREVIGCVAVCCTIVVGTEPLMTPC